MADRYWAFISYSHRDEAWSRWLHRCLETFRLPRRIAGRETRSGKIPARLFPVFRDRDELPGSSELGRNLESALAASEYLVVICSPHAASSRWVDEEVRRFKAMGRADRILALIVDGEPNASDKPELGLAECFPPALSHQVDAAGRLCEERVEPIAADVRPRKDGKHAALLKIVAGIAGVGYDELRQRDRQRTVRNRVVTAAAAVATASALLGVAHWNAERARLDALEERGREALMAGESGQAAAYLAEAYREGRDSDSLRLMLGIAMPMVEKVRATIQAHKGGIHDVAITADGALVASAGEDGVRIWRAQDGRPLRSLERDGTYSTLRFGPGDATLVGLGAKGVRTWQVSSGAVTADFQIPRHAARKRLGSGGRILYLDHGGEVEVWSVADGRRLGSVAIKDRFTLAENGSGTLAFFMDTDDRNAPRDHPHRVRAFELPTLTPRFEFMVRGFPWAWDFDARESRIALATRAGDLGIWDVADGRRLLETRYPSYLRDVRFSPDGSELLVASFDGTVKAWDAGTGWLRQSLEGHRGAVLNAEYLPGADRVLTRGADGTLRLWDRRLGDPLITLEAHKEQSLRSFVGAGGRSLVSSNARRGELSFWSLERTQPARTLAAHKERIHTVEMSPRGDRMLTASDEEARLWTYPGLELVATFERSYAAFVGSRVVASSNREARVVVADAADGRIELEHSQAGKPLMFFVLARDRSEAIVFANDASAVRVTPGRAIEPLPLASLRREREVHLSDWSPDKQRIAFTAEGAGGIVRLADDSVEMRATRKGDVVGAAKFSLEGDSLFLVDGHDLRVFDVRSGTLSATRTLATNPFFFERLCNDRIFILSAHDKTVTLLDAASARVMARLSGHTGIVLGADCDAALRYVFTGSLDGTTRLWRIQDGKPLASFGSGRRPHFGVSLSRDGRTLVNSGDDGALRVWSVQREARPSELVAASVACRVPWRVKGVDLEPVEPKAQNCPP